MNQKCKPVVSDDIEISCRFGERVIVDRNTFQKASELDLAAPARVIITNQPFYAVYSVTRMLVGGQRIQLTVDNVIDFWATARTLQLRTLVEQLENFVAEHLGEVARARAEMLKVDDKFIERLLDKRRNKSPTRILYRWWKADVKGRQAHFIRLVSKFSPEKDEETLSASTEESNVLKKVEVLKKKPIAGPVPFAPPLKPVVEEPAPASPQSDLNKSASSMSLRNESNEKLPPVCPVAAKPAPSTEPSAAVPNKPLTADSASGKQGAANAVSSAKAVPCTSLVLAKQMIAPMKLAAAPPVPPKPAPPVATLPVPAKLSPPVAALPVSAKPAPPVPPRPAPPVPAKHAPAPPVGAKPVTAAPVAPKAAAGKPVAATAPPKPARSSRNILIGETLCDFQENCVKTLATVSRDISAHVTTIVCDTNNRTYAEIDCHGVIRVYLNHLETSRKSQKVRAIMTQLDDGRPLMWMDDGNFQTIADKTLVICENEIPATSPLKDMPDPPHDNWLARMWLGADCVLLYYHCWGLYVRRRSANTWHLLIEDLFIDYVTPIGRSNTFFILAKQSSSFVLYKTEDLSLTTNVFLAQVVTLKKWNSNTRYEIVPAACSGVTVVFKISDLQTSSVRFEKMNISDRTTWSLPIV